MNNRTTDLARRTARDRGDAARLADHLDAALARSEDLLAAAPEDPASTSRSVRALLRQHRDIASLIETIHARELIITLHILKARELTKPLRRANAALATILPLFDSGTHALADAARDVSSETSAPMRNSDGQLAYLKSRALVPAATTTLPSVDQVLLGEDLLLHGLVRVGTLMDLLAGTLDALENAFDLYDVSADAAIAPNTSEPAAHDAA